MIDVTTDDLTARIHQTAERDIARPLVVHGPDLATLAVTLTQVASCGVPCVVEERTGAAAHIARGGPENGPEGPWTVAVWVGERNQHRWTPPDGDGPIVLDRPAGGHKLVYHGR